MIKTIASRGSVGIGSCLAAIGMTLARVEDWLRIAGAIVGIAVGIVTLISLIQHMRRRARIKPCPLGMDPEQCPYGDPPKPLKVQT